MPIYTKEWIEIEKIWCGQTMFKQSIKKKKTALMWYKQKTKQKNMECNFMRCARKDTRNKKTKISRKQTKLHYLE